MKKYLLTLALAIGAGTMVIADAEARRLGGGASFGRQSQNVTRQAPPARQATPPSQQQATPAAAPAAGAAGAKAASPWRGMLGGALLGLGLGALLTSLGFGPAMASFISTLLMVGLLAMAAMFIYRMVTRRRTGMDQQRPAYAGGYPHQRGMDQGGTPEIGSRLEPAPLAFPAATGAAAADAGDWDIPADFDVPAFLRNAKTSFIRMQAAWDRADLNDIRDFTSPEMFAELKMQLADRGASANHTDVVSVEAELLGVQTLEYDYLASVRFTGLIRETEEGPTAPFEEIWNMAKPKAGDGGWVLAGLQQQNTH